MMSENKLSKEQIEIETTIAKIEQQLKQYTFMYGDISFKLKGLSIQQAQIEQEMSNLNKQLIQFRQQDESRRKA